MKRKWFITFALWHKSEILDGYLSTGWEPFAVTDDRDGTTIWLRRRA